jgi:hypothetical protein
MDHDSILVGVAVGDREFVAGPFASHKKFPLKVRLLHRPRWLETWQFACEPCRGVRSSVGVLESIEAAEYAHADRFVRVRARAPWLQDF